jgi:hypothetical protein
MNVLKIILIAIGIIIVIFLGLIWAASWFLEAEHTKKQRCPECGCKAIYIGEALESSGYPDPIDARYKCPKGHIFNKSWATRKPFT